MKIKTDPYGVIVQPHDAVNWDGGDSVNWEGHRRYLDDSYYGAVGYKRYFKRTKYGYERHPTSGGTASYYKDPWNGNISRDQLTGILAYTIKRGDTDEMIRIIIHHMAWLMLFSYNTVRNHDIILNWKWPDVTFMDIWAMEIRGLGFMGWVLWPLLNVLDIHMLLNTISFNLWSKDDDCISFALKAIVQIEHKPTLTSWIAWKILNKEKLKGLVKEYWCGWRNNCGMYQLYRNKL